VLVVRSRKPFFKSKPGRPLLAATLLIAAVTLLLPYTPLAGILGFEMLPFSFVLVLAAIVAVYVVSAEVVKKIFYARVKF